MARSAIRATLRRQRQVKRSVEAKANGIGFWLEHEKSCKQFIIFGKRPLEAYIKQHG